MQKIKNHTKKNYLKIQNNSCCSDSEKATVGVAVEPNAQCFADCCPVCPPEDCCDSITINYDCRPPKAPPECTCPCVFDGFSFNENIKFKPKKTPDNAGLHDIAIQAGIEECVNYEIRHVVYNHTGAVVGSRNWTQGTMTLIVTPFGGGDDWVKTFAPPGPSNTVTFSAPEGNWSIDGSDLWDYVYGDGATCTGEDWTRSNSIDSATLNGVAYCGCTVKIKTTGTQSEAYDCPAQAPYVEVEPGVWEFSEALCDPRGGNVAENWWMPCDSWYVNCGEGCSTGGICCPSVGYEACPTLTPTPTATQTQTPRPTPTRTPYLSPTATPYLSPTPTASGTPTATPTPTPTPTPTEEPYYCVQKKEACERGGCAGYYRPVACEPCVYTRSAPSGTEIDVYIEPNARSNCDRFEPYAPGSQYCEPGDDGSPSPWLNDHKEIEEEGLCSVGEGKINACLPVSNIDLRVWKIINGPFDGKEACDASNCCDYEDEPTPTPTETPTPTPTTTCPACENPSVELTFNGCCLVLEGDSIVAVGSGTVSASVSGGGECDLEVKLNGNGSSISVEDGDTVNVELTGCDCCETKRICNSGQSSLWFSTKNKIKLNKTTFLDTIKFIYNKIKKKKA